MNAIVASYQDILRPYQARLADLAVPTEFLRSAPVPDQRAFAPRPTALKASCQECGDPLVTVAQFWAHGRLWAVGFCSGWASHVSSPTASLHSVPAGEALADGTEVKGNSVWTRTPALVLRASQDPQFHAHPVLDELGLATEDSDELQLALAGLLGAVTSSDDQDTQGPRWGDSCLGGLAMPIQWSHADDSCPHCNQRLTFLGQFGPEVGLLYGDSGALYAFACLEHPEYTVVDCQMC